MLVYTVGVGKPVNAWAMILRKLSEMQVTIAGQQGKPRVQQRIREELADAVQLILPLLETAWIAGFNMGERIPGIDTLDVLRLLERIREWLRDTGKEWAEVDIMLIRRLLILSFNIRGVSVPLEGK